MRVAAVVAFVVPLAAACGGDDCRDNGDGTCGGGLVCARSAECLPADEVQLVRVTWTVRGQPASETNCSAFPDLYTLFYGNDPRDEFGFAPVPCKAGLFTIDRLPKRYFGVELGVDKGTYKLERSFNAQGNAAFDLMP